MSKCSNINKEPLIFVKGGILFEQIRETPVTINAPTVLFTRSLNFSTLETAITECLQFSNSYKQYCDTLHNKVQLAIKTDLNDRYFVSSYNMSLINADMYCASKNARLPEIRDDHSYNDILTLAKLNDIPIIPAGIIPDSNENIYRFASDKLDAYSAQRLFPSIYYYFEKIETYKPCLVGNKGGYYDDPDGVKLAKNTILAYAKEYSLWQLQILDRKHTSLSYKVICENIQSSHAEKLEQSLLLRMASHACKRDLYNVKQLTELMIAETKLFVKIDQDKIDQINRLDKRSDNFETNNFNNQLMEPGIFCSLHHREIYSTTCDKFMDFHIILMDVTNSISKIINVPDTFIASYFTTILISMTELIKVNRRFNPCIRNAKLDKINHNNINEDISRLIDLTIVASDTCARWHNTDYSDYYLDKLQQKDIEVKFLPIVDAFYKLGFTRPKAPSGVSLSEFNQHIQTTKKVWLNARHSKREDYFPFDNYISDKFSHNSSDFLDKHTELLRNLENYKLLNARNRSKRFAPAVPIISGFVLFDATKNLIEGKAPLSGLGKLTSQFTGLVHQDDLKPYLKLLEQHSKVIESLNFNQQELEKAYNSLAEGMETMNNMQKRLEFSVATTFQEIDYKSLHKTLIDTIEKTIMKLSIIITNAQMKVVSPYLIDPAEMLKIATDFRANRIFLSDNLNDAEAAYIYNDKQFKFIINMPVLNDKDKYKIYKASKIPIFTNKGVFEADIDAQYVAHSITSNNYRVLSEEEYSICKYYRMCKTADVERPIRPSSHCVIRTISKDTTECKLVESKQSDPFYYINKNNLIYSVKGPLPATLLCDNNTPRKTIYLEGIGIAKIDSGCKIFFENDMIAYINPEPEEIDLGQVKFMQVFKYMPRVDDFNIEIKYDNATIIYYKPNLTEVDTNSFTHIWNEIQNPSQVIPELIRVLTGIAIAVTIILLLCCCSKKFAVWFKTCIFWKNPKHYWVTYRKYDLSTFDKYKPNFKNKSNICTNFFRMLCTSIKSESEDEIPPVMRPIIKNQNINSPSQKRVTFEDKAKTIVDKLKEEEKESRDKIETDKLFTRENKTMTSFPTSEKPKTIYPAFSYVSLPQAEPYAQNMYISAPRYDDIETNYVNKELKDLTIIIDQPMSEYHNHLFQKPYNTTQ